MTQTALILGGRGKIGSHATKAFEKAGWRVVQYHRDRGDLNTLAKTADVIVNGLNPPAYHDWARTIPAITKQVIAAARQNDATVIIPGNVYNFGDRPGTWDENTAQVPCSRKGRIRVEMEQAYRDAGVKTIVLRAGNFIDPMRNQCIGSLMLLRAIEKGKVTYAGRHDAMQAYCYLPDWARAAVMLAEKREALAPFEDVPLGGHAFTAQQLQSHLAARLGRTIKIVNFPWWFMTMAAPFWELAREMREMRYLWSVDHALGTEKLQRLLPEFTPSPLPEVMEAALPPQIHPDHSVTGSDRTVLTA